MRNLNKETLGAWVKDADLPIKNYAYQGVVIGDRLYMIGGRDNTSVLNTVYHAPILEDGSIGTWVRDVDLPISTSSHQCVVTKNRLYVIGGHGGGTGALDAVYYACILEDGSLGDWVEDSNLPMTNYGQQCVVIKDRLYMIGGYSDSVLNTIHHAPILEDGSLGDWVRDNDLPIINFAHQCVVTNNRLYMIGGIKGSTLSKVYYAPISEDGSLGVWVKDTDSPISSFAHHCVVIEDRLYMIGGVEGYRGLNTVHHAPILEDGSLGTWTQDTDLPIGNYGHQCVVTKNRLYMIGGYNSVNGYSDAVYYAPISR